MAALLVASTACSDEPDGGTEAFPARCGLLTPDPGLDRGVVPDAFLVEGVQVVKSHASKRRVTVALNAPFSVAESFETYKEATEEAGYELVGQDNEGFEAEIYMRKGDELGSIQVRMSRCPDKTVVFINIVQT